MTEDFVPPSPSASHAHDAGRVPAGRRKRGRPLEVQPHEVLGRIRDLAGRGALVRVHLDEPALYARARRMFGTWAAALHAAGVDHGAAVQAARRRAVEKRRGRRSRPAR